jgi:hypothetical protein
LGIPRESGSRAVGITAYLEAGGTLENAHAMAAHESPRTTKLYDRTGDEITLDEVERFSPQTVFDAPGEGGGAHSSLPPQPVFGAFAKSIPKSPNYNYYAKIAVFCGGLTNA